MGEQGELPLLLQLQHQLLQASDRKTMHFPIQIRRPIVLQMHDEITSQRDTLVPNQTQFR